jgi:protein-S-isoprenylcysteine O-methyltransferase Ste14
MLIGRGLWRGKWAHLKHLFRNRRVKTTILSLCVKGFFAPLMTSFLSGHANNISRMWANRKHQPVFTGATFSDWWHYVHDVVPKLLPDGSDFSAIFSSSWYTLQNVRFSSDVFYDLLFFLDTIWALMGYCSESQWFKNKTRSVEPTALGWAAAIFCYPPFNDILGTYLPLSGNNGSMHRFLVDTLGRSADTAEWTILWCRILMLASFTIYVWATLAFGMKFSNLTNRGTVSRGPYAFFRHPAYVCKGFAWWMEYLPNMSLQTAFFLVGLNGVYALRAWTEERHLSMDPTYREYKKKVPWVLIPRVW